MLMEETKDEEKPLYAKANKGEWSELYVLLKLLADGKMYGADENVEIIEGWLYPVSAINHKTLNNEDIRYEILENSEKIKISLDNSEVEQLEISSIAQDLLQAIKEAGKGTFTPLHIDSKLSILKFPKLKASSRKKQDISIVIRDARLNTKQDVAFSIKSQLGSPSTLFNASPSTNFSFEITGLERKGQSFIKSLDDKKPQDLIKSLTEGGCKLNFEKLCGDVLDSNMALIDTKLKDIWAVLLVERYKRKENNIKELTDFLIEENPLDFKKRDAKNFYPYKIKQFLSAVALGMTPAKLWEGLYDANGGYIIVRKDGELACYHIYNWNAFQDYLFENTYLEGASTTRHGYGKLYQKDGKYFVNLNLQIRFTS